MCASDHPYLRRQINPSPPPPLNPPSPGAPAGDPCFPSSSIVTKADGSPSRIDALKEGDEILAATHDGALTTDVVSLLSIAKPEAKAAAYVALASAANKTVTLTAGHHVPVGATCCATLEQAKNVQVSDGAANPCPACHLRRNPCLAPHLRRNPCLASYLCRPSPSPTSSHASRHACPLAFAPPRSARQCGW